MRHFKALSRKNWINYKRTPMGNFLELMCPLMLTLIIYGLRINSETDWYENNKIKAMRHPLYPVMTYDDDLQKYQTNMKQMLTNGDELQKFMQNGEAVGNEGYIPFADFLGPMLWYPHHCSAITDDRCTSPARDLVCESKDLTSQLDCEAQLDGRGNQCVFVSSRDSNRVKDKIFASPLIAYIKDPDNKVQDDLVAQIKAHFESFDVLVKLVNTNPLLTDLVEGSLSGIRTPQARDSEAMLRAYDSQINLWSGADRQFSKMTFPNMTFSMQEFESKESLEEYIAHPDYGHNKDRPGVCVGMALKEHSKNNYEFEVFANDAIVLDYRSLPDQMDSAADDTQTVPRMRSYAYYSYYGISYLQNWAANTVLRHVTNNRNAEIVAMTLPMKIFPLLKDPFVALTYFILPYFIMLMFIPMVYRITYRIVKEKELRTKELMLMMGMQTSSYWISWLVYFTITNTILSTVGWIVLNYGCFRYVSGIVLWLVIWLYGQAIFGFIMLMQSFFEDARTAAVVTTIAYFGLAFALQVREQAPTYQKVLMGLTPTACMTQTLKVILGFELNASGIYLNNAHRMYRNFSVQIGCIMFVISFFVQNLIGLYFDAVMPRQHGKTYSCCYCLKSKKKNEWLSYQDQDSNADTEVDFTIANKIFETKNMNPECYEGVSSGLKQLDSSKRFMKLVGLEKEYGNGTKAVNGINLKLYADQIFVLLGHNGAGKTSTISLLTGLYDPSKGSAEAFGIDMFKDFKQIRQFLGICPQHDVLFDLLTPEEHLDIFYDFKGADPDPVKKQADIDKIIKDIHMGEKKNDLAMSLSGGYKRKLSVSLSLVGGSKLIIMDEPTASLDLTARRQIWNMLKEQRKDRIILLSTHYMDEADILGDRIGIMTQGKITCLGSSLFLKRKFGAGYNLTMLKKQGTKGNNLKIMPYLIENLGPQVKKIGEIQSEFQVQIPTDLGVKLPSFFKKFDQDLVSIDVANYGIAISTLEDVFHNVGHLEDPADALKESHQAGPEASSDSKSQVSKKGTPEFCFGTSVNQVAPFKPSRQSDQGLIKNYVDTSVVDISHSQHNIELPSIPQTQTLTRPMFEIDDKVDMSDLDVEDEKRGTGFPPEGAGPECPTSLFRQRSDMSQVSQSPQDRSPIKLEELQSETDLQDGEQGTGEFVLSQSKSADPAWLTFTSVINKRLLMYANRNNVIIEILIPALVMIIGTSAISIDFFFRSDSRIMSPSRVSTIPNAQKVLFKDSIFLDNYDQFNNKTEQTLTARSFGENLTGKKDYLDVIYKDPNDFVDGEKFEVFDDYVFWFGQVNAGTWPYLYSAYEVYEANKDTQKYKFYNWVNLTNQDATGLYPQFMYESILKTATDDNDFSYKCKLTPYPVTFDVKNRAVKGNAAKVVFFTAVAYGMMLTQIVGQIVNERVGGLKHMQMICGMHRGAYWVANFAIDLFKMTIVNGFALVTFYVFNLGYDSAFMIYLMFPLAAIPYTYVMSFVFETVSAAQTGTMFLNFGCILFASQLTFYLRWIKEQEILGDQLHYTLRMFPAYTLGQSIYFDSNMDDLVQFREDTLGPGQDLTSKRWTLETVGGDMLSLGCHFVLWVLMLIVIETGLAKKLNQLYTNCQRGRFPQYRRQENMDTDVTDEADRVAATKDQDLQIKVENLRKVYLRGGVCNPGKPLCAVENLSFGLSKGECFALLGINGAGKSTTFKTLTAEEEPTSGKITVQGMDMITDFQKVRKLIGYCPQYNPIFESLTVQQNIEYFARIKGIPKYCRDSLIKNVVDKLGLMNHRDKASGTLSGGNKRKLSVAIAIVGNPPIILLDEPSAGMDPEARRFMWSVVANIASQKTSAVILTSHLMEEAEALCTKMGIMVKGGVFKCFGSTQHIKNKYGFGFEVEIKVEIPSHQQLQELADQELAAYQVARDGKAESMADVGAALYGLTKTLQLLVVDKIREEIVSTYRQARDTVDITFLESKRGMPFNYYNASKAKVHISAVVLAEKLFTQRNLYGTIKAICKVFGSIELLEGYGHYMRLRVSSSKDQTIGQMFGMIDELKEAYNIDQYSISQTTLEQIFQSFANLNFNNEVKTYTLDSTDQIIETHKAQDKAIKADE